MAIKLSKQEATFLASVLALPDDLRLLLVRSNERGVSLTEGQADALRDLCGERLQTRGFDRDWETTGDGALLEALIDKLFIG